MEVCVCVCVKIAAQMKRGINTRVGAIIPIKQPRGLTGDPLRADKTRRNRSESESESVCVCVCVCVCAASGNDPQKHFGALNAPTPRTRLPARPLSVTTATTPVNNESSGRPNLRRE